MSAENDGNSIPTETDPMIGTVETEYVLAGIEAIGNSRTGPLLAGKTLTSRDSGKYETFSHMSDVVDEVLSRSGISLQEISRKGMSETHIESAQRSQIGMLQKVNQYTVTAEIARGSFGVVYLVESDFDNNGTLYAMKTFPAAKVKSLPRGRMPGPSKESNELQSIRKEIALMKKLIHPNITRLYEVVEESIFPHSIYMIMEYVGGGVIMSVRDDVPTHSEDGGQLPPQWACVLTGGTMGESLASKLFRQFIGAMEFLHINLVAHRDLKPENILVTIEGDIKIADFGVSQDFSAQLNSGDSDSSRLLGMVKDTKGSWSYWAPEMIDDKQSNSYSAYAADVWASGVCLWQFVFGCLPFWAPQPGNSPSLMFEAILSIKDGLPALPSRKSPELVQLITAMLEADPVKRPAFKDLSSFAWIREHTSESVEQQLKQASTRTIDRSADSLDVSNAVTPGQVNILTENSKAHILGMAQRVKARVRERRSSIKAAKEVEIQTKKEVRRSFDSQISADLSAQLIQEKIRTTPPTTPLGDRDGHCEKVARVSDVSVGGVGVGWDRDGSVTPPIAEETCEHAESTDTTVTTASVSLVQQVSEATENDCLTTDSAASEAPKSFSRKSGCCTIQ